MLPLLILTRALHIGSALLLGGLLFFRQTYANEENAFSQRLSRWMIGAWLIQLLSGAAWLWLVIADMNDVSWREALDPPYLQTVLGQTDFGHLWIIRAIIALTLGLLLFTRRAKTLSLFLGAALLFSLAWAGHAASATHFRALHLGADILHLTVGAIWPAGLVPLFLFLQSTTNPSHAIATANRFSRTAFIAVMLLALTGLANAWFLLPNLAALVTSPYGQLLLIKIAIFFTMIALGSRNRHIHLPALATNPAAFARLRRTVLLESLLALLILLIVGWMGATAPPPPG